MKFFIIFEPLKDRKSLKIGIVSALIIALIYFIFSAITGLLSIRQFPDAPFIIVLQFAILKSFSQFRLFDWILFFAFPLTGGLLFANYSFRKCKDASAGSVGLIAGLIAATCPACILPLLGLASATTFVAKVSNLAKLGILVFIITTTYVVALKSKTCLPEDSSRNKRG